MQENHVTWYNKRMAGFISSSLYSALTTTCCSITSVLVVQARMGVLATHTCLNGLTGLKHDCYVPMIVKTFTV